MSEWDEQKRQDTLAKRHLDFADVALVNWDEALTAQDKRFDYAETRYVTLAPIHQRLCVFAWCYRGKNIRIISLRKANSREIKHYEES